MKQFTEQQLKDYEAYEKVRLSGRYNMFDPHAVRATGLFRDEYLFVMTNIAALRAASLGEQHDL